ncbi:MAG: 7-carboxy-7-deazaguanine synthase QueE [Planctomycetota bacterium]
MSQPLPQADPRVLVSETFCSLQGEGALAGTPSWFLRLSGCNLRCRWCDTPYASWSPEGERRSVDGLIGEGLASGVRHAVLTGGEPMIFPELAAIASGLRAGGMHVTIETAGTVDRPEVEFDLMSVSPKLSNSTPLGDPRDPGGAWAGRHDRRRLDAGALGGLLRRGGESGRSRQVKFVVTGEADLAEIEGVLALPEVVAAGLAPEEVFLMPEGTAVPEPASVAWVVGLCRERGWRYGHRLHIELFGDTRGT